MAKIRVLVADDSLTVRKRLVEALTADPELEVVGEAKDGKGAIELCRELRPDVVTLDMIMPVMSGLAATEYIMAYCPTPIVIVSASTNRGELFKTYEALAAGAVEVLDKPKGNESSADEWAKTLTGIVKLASRIKVITHPRGRLGQNVDKAAAAQSHSAARTAPLTSARSIVAMGASTGGPGAIVSILRQLPKDFPLPILLTLHIGATFASSFADWLDEQSHLRVAYARHGEPLPLLGSRRVLLAPPDRHMVVRGGTITLTDEEERHACRPSIDVLFESVAREVGEGAVGCLLTGMGKDGAAGLLAIREAGGATLAQDEATCVVFGMPREAIRIGAAQRVLPLGGFAAALAAQAPAAVAASRRAP